MDFRSLSLAVFSFLSLTLTAGCLGGGARVDVAGGGVEGAGAGVSGAAVEERSGDFDVAEAQPQAGGTSAPLAEHGDEHAYFAQGSIEPVCRMGEERIQYRLTGQIFRKSANDSVNVGGCLSSQMTVRFWNGQTCETSLVDLEDCSFDVMMTLGKTPIYNLYKKGVSKVDLDPSMGPLSAEDEPGASNPGLVRAIDASKLKKTNLALQDLANVQFVCKISDHLPIEDQLVEAIVSDPLPDCETDPLSKPKIRVKF